MDFQEAVNQRRSVKHYDTDFVIPQKDIDLILDLAKKSPSSFNIQHWRIVNVEDPSLRSNIQEVAWNQAQVTEASHLFIICADIKAFEKNPDSYWRDAPRNIADLMVGMIGTFYQGKEQLQRDEALRSVGIIAQTIMLSVKSLGYDSCPMIGFDSEKVGELIHLPQDHLIGMMLTLGKAKEPAKPRSGFIQNETLYIKDKF